MAKTIEELLNPESQELTEEQIVVQTTFAEVDREMDAIDRLAALISSSIQDSAKKSGKH